MTQSKMGQSGTRRAVVSYAVDETPGGRRMALVNGLADIAAELIEIGIDSREDIAREFEQIANDVETEMI